VRVFRDHAPRRHFELSSSRSFPSPSPLPALLRCVLLALVLLGLIGCQGCGCGKSDAALDAATASEPPVPPPEGLLAEAVVVDPNVTWGKVQRGTGGALALMPMNLGGLATSLASLDPTLGSEIDGTAPAFGAVAAGPSGIESVSYAVAIRLLDERRTRGTLFDGPNARYTARDTSAGTLLVPKGGTGAATPLPVAAAVARGGFLLLARNEADLVRLGPYVSRTLSARPLPSGSVAVDVPHSAFSGPISPYLASLWSSFRADMEQQDARMREAHGGKVPDFGDPRAIVEMGDAFVKDKIGILGDLERARIVIDPSDDGMRIVATFVPLAGDGPAARTIRAMRVGNAAPLLDVPKGSSTALLLRSDADERRENAHDVSLAVAKALGDRIDPDGREKLEHALADWSKGRGDFLSVSWLGLGFADARSGVLVHAPATDAESASRALRSLVGLGEKPAFKGPLETFLQVRQISTSQVDVPGLGKVELSAITRGPSKKGGEPPKKAGVAWRVYGAAPGSADGAQIDVAMAEDPIALLREPSENAGKAGDDPDFASAVKRLGSDVTSALVVRRTALDPARAGAGLALVLTWGREGSDARAYLEASHALTREAIRRAGGF